jgi:pantothenate kinase-related protein Tda10
MDPAKAPPLEPSPPDAARKGAIATDKATVSDQLAFEPYVKTLADIIADGDTQTPLTMGIFGALGSGKTSLMQMIGKALEER